jgi:circadian clock protein KaiC
MEFLRISTGIASLDHLLGGGYIKGRSYLIAGDTGTGKTTACLQFLINALAQGEKAVYVTVDERPAEILAAAASYSWDLQPHIQQKNLVILDAASGSATEKGIDPQKMVADLGNYAKGLGATVLIIDPITPLLLPGNPAVPVQVHARALIQLIQSQLATTTVLTSHAVQPGEPDPTAHIEQFLTSGVLVLKSAAPGQPYQRVMHIKKMRYTPVNPGEYPFAMMANAGIVLVNGAAPSAAPVPSAERGFFRSFEIKEEQS